MPPGTQGRVLAGGGLTSPRLLRVSSHPLVTRAASSPGGLGSLRARTQEEEWALQGI